MVRSGGFGGGPPQDVVVVAEDGGDLDGAADGLDVAGDGVDGGHLAALDLGDTALVTPMRLAAWAWVRPRALRRTASRCPSMYDWLRLRASVMTSSPPTSAAMPPRTSCHLGNSVIVLLPPRAP